MLQNVTSFRTNHSATMNRTSIPVLLTFMLLVSPSDYFRDDQDLESSEKLDLLMLTQGWSRYFWGTIPVPETKTLNVESEGITLSGSVRGALSKKPVKRGNVNCNIYDSEGLLSYETVTDNEGKFSFQKLYFTDSAGVFIQGFNNKGRLYTEVLLDSVFSDGSLVGTVYLPVLKSFTDFPVNLYQQQYFNEVELRDYLLKTGSIYLEGVTIIGDKKRYQDDGHFRIYGKSMDSFTLTEKDISYRNIADYLQGRVAGVTVVGNSIIIRGPGTFGAGGSPLFLLDGVPFQNQDIVMNIPMNDIEVIEVLKNPLETAIFGTRAANGVISVFTKKGGAGGYSTYTPGTLAKNIAGYASYREFYTPAYTPENVDSEKPDHRITLYWNPDVIIEEEKTSISFFTSDDLSGYRIIVEGITRTGEVCLGYSELKVDEVLTAVDPR